MPRGENPNSRANLERNSEKTPEERRKRASKMGKASGVSRRKKAEEIKSLSDTAIAAVTQADKDAIIKKVVILARNGSLPHIEKLAAWLKEQDQTVTEIRIIDEDPQGAEYNG